jgi:4-oxalocrotonate tautomerase
MPIITVQFIKDVVANDEQKQELIVKLTDTFISVVGEVARPFVYCIIQETPQMEWGNGGKPMPDLAWLTGPEYTGQKDRSNEIMGKVVESLREQHAEGGGDPDKDALAANLWKGAKAHE